LQNRTNGGRRRRSYAVRPFLIPLFFAAHYLFFVKPYFLTDALGSMPKIAAVSAEDKAISALLVVAYDLLLFRHSNVFGTLPSSIGPVIFSP
jgi:hypothetical protein